MTTPSAQTMLELADAVLTHRKVIISTGYKQAYFRCGHCHEHGVGDDHLITHKSDCPVLIALSVKACASQPAAQAHETLYRQVITKDRIHYEAVTQAPEPVAWRWRPSKANNWYYISYKPEPGNKGAEVEPLYALSPPAPDAVREPGFVKPDNDRQVFFYEQDFYVLSNFSAFNLEWKGKAFPTSEQAYHYSRFPVHGGWMHRAEILKTRSAHDAFRYAQENRRWQRDDWDALKVGVMRDILRAKVDQHEYVRRKLLATGDRELIEDSWRDSFWGWGPNRDGQNMLGKLWMEVRAELRAALAPPDAGRRG